MICRSDNSPPGGIRLAHVHRLLDNPPPGRTRAEGEEMTDDDPNEAYEVVPIEPGAHGPPKGWWTVKRNGLPVRHFPGKEKAQRYATDPEYRASLIAGKAWQKA
jgi:hypothetical protein